MLTLKIGGAAGQGIKAAGLLLSKVATRSGFQITTYTEYPSLIRGSHNVMQINISPSSLGGPYKKTDFLIALNQETLDLHFEELTENAGVLWDEKAGLDVSKINKNVNLFPLPLSDLANQAQGNTLMINTVSLGATLAIFGGNLQILNQLIAEEFVKNSPEIVSINQQVAKLGFDFVLKTFPDKISRQLEPSFKDKKMVVNGNEAIAIGAIAAGMQFAAVYPMTPTSNILTVLAANQEKYGFVYKQPEDEIAAINMAIGASFAGARSMVATSGGGFCLMSEGLGLAANTETPLVIIEGMRPGPATGMPTWSEQGDLQFILHAAHGDFPKIVLAAGDSKEAFDLTIKAFNLADKYQTPVILLVDKNICEGDQSFSIFNMADYKISQGKFERGKIENYERFSFSEDGISTRTIPGSGNYFLANSDEHDPTGFSSEEAENRKAMMEKRMKKLETCQNEDMPQPELFGPDKADLTLVSWGSNKTAILDTLKNFSNVNFLHLTWFSPFPTDFVKNTLVKSKHIIGIECNFSGQLLSLIKEKTGIEITDKLLKYDGRPFFVEEITEKIKSILKK